MQSQLKYVLQGDLGDLSSVIPKLLIGRHFMFILSIKYLELIILKLILVAVGWSAAFELQGQKGWKTNM